MDTTENKETPENPVDENYSFDGNTYTYTDKISSKKTPIHFQYRIFCNDSITNSNMFPDIVYIWDLEKKTWADKSQLEKADSTEKSKQSVDDEKTPQLDLDSAKESTVSDDSSVVKTHQEKPNPLEKSAKNAPKSKKSDDEEEKDSDEETEKAEPMKQDMSKGVYGYEDDTYTYTDSTDGTKYFWDKEKNAWFPKVTSS